MSRAADAPAPTHWASVGESGAVLGMWLLYWINRLFGRWPFRAALAPVVLYFVIRQRLARGASRQYLERLEAHTGALGHPPRWRDTFRHISLFSETVLDKLLAIGGRYRFESLTFEGREVMVESFAAKRGGVLLTAHMGNLEVLRTAAERKVGLKLNVLVHTKHAERFNSVLRRLDPTTEVNLLQVTDFSPATAAALSERVERGEFVVLAADRVPVSETGRVIHVPFLGQPAPFPVGPWILASALKCQVILLTALHQGKSYHVRFERYQERVELPRAHRGEALEALVSGYARRLEEACKKSPLDWFNFYPFWDSVHEQTKVA
jgi:predicted LPLAT superfamily acyltransferase